MMPQEREYVVCTNCVMDTTDANITFDARGWCDYCNNYYENVLPSWHTDERGVLALATMSDEIKRAGDGRQHDNNSRWLQHLSPRLPSLRH